MAEVIENSSSFNLICFEDDFDKHVEEINEYYEYLETHDYIELNWKCPGRTTIPKIEDAKAQVVEMAPKESNPKNDFDFDFDEPTQNQPTTPQLNRTPKTLTGNKKKSATTFNSVMEKLKKRS